MVGGSMDGVTNPLTAAHSERETEEQFEFHELLWKLVQIYISKCNA